METLPPIDTAPLFAPLHRRLIALLEGLTPADWSRPTVAGSWEVRDVAAHLLEVDLRRLTVARDAYPIDPGRTIDGYGELVAFLNELNAQWVAVARRFSRRVLIELLQVSGPAMTRMVTGLPPHDPAAFAVAWAGELRSENWFDIGRDYTERWHHQMQIRDAVEATGLLQQRWLVPLLDLSVRCLPVAYAGVPADGDPAVVLRVRLGEAAADPDDRDVETPGGGEVPEGVIDHRSGEAVWTLRHQPVAIASRLPGGAGSGQNVASYGASSRWHLWRGPDPSAETTIRLDADTAWRLFYNALPPEQVRRRAVIEGNPRLAEPLFRARSVMV